MAASDKVHRPTMIVGIVCGTLAALAWAMGFVAAKHGVQIGFSPADLAFHRFFWSGLLMLPLIVREGLRDLGGIGWSRASVMTVLSGPPQSLLAYTGFILVPLGHGTTIQPACAALSGLVLASLILHEKATLQRIAGGAIIIAGLLMFGAESLTTIGNSGVGGDLLFATAGLFWATFGTLLISSFSIMPSCAFWKTSGSVPMTTSMAGRSRVAIIFCTKSLGVPKTSATSPPFFAL